MHGVSGQCSHLPTACRYPVFPFWPNTNLSGRQQHLSCLKHSAHFVQSCSTEAVISSSMIKPQAFHALLLSLVLCRASPSLAPLHGMSPHCPLVEGSLGVPAGSTSYQQEVCASVGLLGNCPQQLARRCLVLKNRYGSIVLWNIYVTFPQKNPNQTKPKHQTKPTKKTHKIRKEERQEEHSATIHVPQGWAGLLQSVGGITATSQIFQGKRLWF